jgi:hypothetical protein
VQVGGLIEIILYVLPGFVANETYKAFYPVRDRGQFPQLGWSVAVGVLLTTTILSVDGRWYATKLAPAPGNMPGIGFVLVLFSTGLAVGLVRALLRYLRHVVGSLVPGLSWLSPDPQSIWVHVNRPSNQDWAAVFLRDGAVYLGYIKRYRYDPEQAEQDFLLSYAKRVDEDLKVVYEIPGQGVYLNTRDVLRIEFIPGSQRE